MTVFAFFLTLSSALSWSGFDFTRKLLVQRIAPLPLTFLVMAGQVPFFLAWALYRHELALAPGYWAPAAGTFGLNIVANILFLWSVKVSPFSAVMPMLSFCPVFTTALGALFLREQPAVMQLAGMALVFGGAVVFHFSRSLLRIEKGAWGMLGVALMFSMAVTCDKASLAYAAPSMHALLMCVVISAAALLAAIVRGQACDVWLVRGALKNFVLASLFASLALGLQFFAYSYTLVGLFEVIKRSSGMAASLALGYFFLKERITFQKIIGVVVMAAGVAAIMLG